MKNFTIGFLILISSTVSFGQFRCQDLKANSQNNNYKTAVSINNNPKSDTVDILHYHLNLDLYSIASMQLEGNAEIKLSPKMANVNSIELDLLEMQVDSIILNNTLLNFNYNDTVVRVYFGSPYSSSDTLILKVYYQGSPIGDASGWGGFHYQSGYYYNLGVGFAADPHTYARVWFPCFDNFVEKSTYSFNVKTKSPNKAYCNGTRLNVSSSGDTLMAEWNMANEIPTYLASVAVSNYQEIISQTTTASSNFPIWLMSKASDTSNLKSSFQNLESILVAFEDLFGPYQWEKVGYAVTTVGAMEHATSIHYPLSLVDGTLGGEDIIAHELAHHWWGNLITCESADDMWINEGLAEYLSHAYLEKVYSRDRYISEVRNNAYLVLNTAHINDDGYRSIHALPHEYVYGTHVYQKGAMVGHNLRAYLGDSLFYSSLQQVLSNNSFGNLNTAEFNNQLNTVSGENLNEFFNSWVYNSGYASFSVDSFHYDSQNQNLFVRVAQNLREAPALFKNVPVEITFFDGNGNTLNKTVEVNGNLGSAIFSNVSFDPEFAIVGYSGKLLSGDTYDHHNIKLNKFYNGQYSKLRVSSKSVVDSAQVIVVHHWAGPKNNFQPHKDYRISKSRFWTIQGYDFDKVDLSARINYNGSNNGLDGDLLQITEDSVQVLYRAQPWENWELYGFQTKTDLGSSTNGIGYIDLENLKPGDYVLANTAEVIGMEENVTNSNLVKIFPNPAKEELIVEFTEDDNSLQEITISDSTGKVISKKLYSLDASKKITINLKGIAASFITVLVNGESHKINLIK